MERFLAYQERVSVSCVFPETEEREEFEVGAQHTIYRRENFVKGTQTRQGKSLVRTTTIKWQLGEWGMTSKNFVVEQRGTYDNNELSGYFVSETFSEILGKRTRICWNEWLYLGGERIKKY
ncbi:hypothetical protein PMV_056 [Port-miou virus]|uniref:Uncharacterized protein n=1 Tax=Port-miou virus TaxID=1733873 RepID=A0A0N9P8I6_9VIRU|nr:hypothetical protein PMV_056 [Port-miou virus]